MARLWNGLCKWVHLMRFEDLKFEESPEGVKRSRTKFGRYELSIICEPGKSLYEAAVFDQHGDFCQLPGIHRTPEHDEDFVDDVIPYLSPEQVTGLMLKMTCIAGKETV